ncbi:hypothetical protein CesoFtcFv8_027125 [Champsocephalus esox]|uniref:Uncharacterized protein n=1 Tax=Champsocephalus esox TaxID=159716 RepID=A0AAN8G6P3_9TELE|nr:hypothetical protein CesoFtcFv8_027125 [Champsocephalus esox]
MPPQLLPCSAPPRGRPQGNQLRVSASEVTAAPAAAPKASQLHISEGQHWQGGEEAEQRGSGGDRGSMQTAAILKASRDHNMPERGSPWGGLR